jgi:hypothetical protein
MGQHEQILGRASRRNILHELGYRKGVPPFLAFGGGISDSDNHHADVFRRHVSLEIGYLSRLPPIPAQVKAAAQLHELWKCDLGGKEMYSSLNQDLQQC